MTENTMAFLQAHGVRMTPDDLSAELEAAVRARKARLRTLDPREEVTATQAANLEAGGLDLSPLGEDEVLQADRTSADYAALIRTSLTTRQMAKLLGRDPSRVRQRINDNTLHAFQVDGGDWHIPEFQVHDGALIPGLATVVSRLRKDLHPLKVERWFLTPNPDLVDESETRTYRPRDWLIAGGDPEAVAQLAEQL